MDGREISISDVDLTGGARKLYLCCNESWVFLVMHSRIHHVSVSAGMLLHSLARPLSSFCVYLSVSVVAYFGLEMLNVRQTDIINLVM